MPLGKLLNIRFLLAALILALIGTKLFGIAGLTLTIAFVVMVMALSNEIPGLSGLIPNLPLNRQMSRIVGLISLILVAVNLGWIAAIQGMLAGAPPAAFVPVATQTVTQQTCADSVASDIRGTASTLDLNAWNLVSNTPYSSPVDLTSNVFVYKNGKSSVNYVGNTTDTSAGTFTGFAVGDTVYMYPGGASYYGDSIEGLCVDSQRKTVNINAYQVIGESSMQVVVYDNTGTNELTAGDTRVNDYNITFGASEETTIYVKLKNNIADRAYVHKGWAVTKLYNMTTVEPVTSDGRKYTADTTRKWMENIALQVNGTETGTTITKDFVPYVIDTPIMLKEWESIKDQFTVKSSSSDPVGRPATTSTNGFAILSFDVTNSRGSDGVTYSDYFTHDTDQLNVGLSETIASPLGKEVGVLILAK